MVQKHKMSFINKPLVDVFVQSDSISNNPNKAIIALEMIMKKHSILIMNNKKALSYFLELLGDFNHQIKKYDKNYYYLSCINTIPKIKLILKCFRFELNKIKYKFYA